MTGKIIDGKALAQECRNTCKEQVAALGIQPGLAAVIVGDNPASKLYVSWKRKACDEVGIYSELHELPATISQDELLQHINELNEDPRIHGILVQLPLPEHIDENTIAEAVIPEKDIDGINPLSLGKLVRGENALVPATPRGIIKLIESTGEDIQGKHAVVIGRSAIVGKPVSLLLQQLNATVTMCHSRTVPLEKYTKDADIIVAAVGKPELITADMVKEGAIVIDVGINKLDSGKLVGDVAFESVKEKAAYITPVPGGCGPMTIAMLLDNVIQAAQNLNK